MKPTGLLIHPYIRLVLLIGGIIAVILTQNNYILLTAYLVVIIPLLIRGGQVKMHFRLLVAGIFPIFLSFILLYILILHGQNGGWNFILFKTQKILLVTSLVQIVMAIPSHALVETFRMWGLRGESLIITLGSFTVWGEMGNRADKIITARFSRGFIGKRNGVNLIRQFPFVLIPLVIGILRTSTERAESWDQKNILHRLQNYRSRKIPYHAFTNIAVLTGVCVWLTVAVMTRIVDI